MKKLSLLVMILVTLVAIPAFALDLATARAQGLVGEQRDGYTVALQQTPEVQQLVTTINARRQQEYQRISTEKGQPLEAVSGLAAKQIFQGLPAGTMYQSDGGNWQKK